MRCLYPKFGILNEKYPSTLKFFDIFQAAQNLPFSCPSATENRTTAQSNCVAVLTDRPHNGSCRPSVCPFVPSGLRTGKMMQKTEFGANVLPTKVTRVISSMVSGVYTQYAPFEFAFELRTPTGDNFQERKLWISVGEACNFVTLSVYQSCTTCSE